MSAQVIDLLGAAASRKREALVEHLVACKRVRDRVRPRYFSVISPESFKRQLAVFARMREIQRGE